MFFATGSSKSFLQDALHKKAAAIVSEEPLPGDIPCLVVTKDVRLLLARMAARFYGYPSRRMHRHGDDRHQREDDRQLSHRVDRAGIRGRSRA